MSPASNHDYTRRACEREINRLDGFDAESAKWRTSSTYPVKFFEDPAIRTRLYFLESVHTALTIDEPLIAFRACLQVYSYASAAVGTERDWLLECRNRIEDVLRAHEQCGVTP